MQRDYSIIPSMIGAQTGIIWSYDDPSKVAHFDETHPLFVSSTICNNIRSVSGIYHQCGVFSIQVTHGMLFWVNGTNG